MEKKEFKAEDLMLDMAGENQPVEQPVETPEDNLEVNPILEEEGEQEQEDVVEEPVNVETPKEEEVVDEPVNDQAIDLDSEIDSWDTDPTPVEPDTSKVVLEQLGLQSDNIDTAKDYIESLKNKVNELEKENSFKDEPPELEKAIAIAKQGGDYLDYLGVSTINYDDYSAHDL